ncbi:MAG: hypothetical protein KF721_16085 [Ignavibacteriaceae bacterium]|nr:hypothetical protein [Ignavibacteriaceae bacterium]
MKTISVLFLFFLTIACINVNDRTSRDYKLIAFFSWEPLSFSFVLDSVYLNFHDANVDSIYFLPKSKYSRDYLVIPKDSLTIYKNIVMGRAKLPNKSRSSYLIADIPPYDSINLMQKTRDSLAMYMKEYIRDNYKFLLYTQKQHEEIFLEDTSSLKLTPVFWGLD